MKGDNTGSTTAEIVCSAIASCRRSNPSKQTISFIGAWSKAKGNTLGNTEASHHRTGLAADGGLGKATQVAVSMSPSFPSDVTSFWYQRK